MRARLAGAAVGVLGAVVLAGCGGGSASASSTTTSASSSSSAVGTSSSAGDASATQVQVKATDFALALGTSSLAPGSYTFVMSNDGNATHAIELDGPGVSDQKSGTAGPGASATLTVTLQAGSYTIYCPVGNHRALGMQTTFTVG